MSAASVLSDAAVALLERSGIRDLEDRVGAILLDEILHSVWNWAPSIAFLTSLPPYILQISTSWLVGLLKLNL